MKTQDIILNALSNGPLCDDCLSNECMIRPRQQVNQQCGRLSAAGLLAREREPCPRCGRFKLVNRIEANGPEKIVQAQFGSETAKALADPQEGGKSVTASLWYWEGNVQSRIAEYLVRNGFQLVRVAKTDTREAGKDIEVRAESGARLWVTVKGYPEKSAHTQARHWFAECLFDLILYREQDGQAELGVGLPDGYATYRNLASRIKRFKSTVGFRFYWVREDGTVHVE